MRVAPCKCLLRPPLRAASRIERPHCCQCLGRNVPRLTWRFPLHWRTADIGKVLRHTLLCHDPLRIERAFSWRRIPASTRSVTCTHCKGCWGAPEHVRGAVSQMGLRGRMKIGLYKTGLHRSSADELWGTVEEEWMHFQNEQFHWESVHITAVEDAERDCHSSGYDPLLRRDNHSIYFLFLLFVFLPFNISFHIKKSHYLCCCLFLCFLNPVSIHYSRC